MGGRGIDSGIRPKQYRLYNEEERFKFNEVKEKTNKQTEGVGIGGIAHEEMPFKECVCCGEKTVPVLTEFYECEICGWIDDPQQNADPDNVVGKNLISLREKRATYLKN